MNSLTKGRRLLELIQILYQNEEIDTQTKDELVNSIKSSLRTGNYAKTNQILRNISFGITMQNEVSECIELTC